MRPILSRVESPEVRRDFPRAFSITHPLVDPVYHGEMTTTLELRPGALRAIYNDGRWVVSETTGWRRA